MAPSRTAGRYRPFANGAAADRRHGPLAGPGGHGGPAATVRGVRAAPSVRVEKRGPVTTVVLSRGHARNAVDGPTAAALADAFREFDADPRASVAVLWGEGGTFC